MTQNLIDKLPKIRGQYRQNAALKNWFDVGGEAEILFKPADFDDLGHFLKNCPKNVPITVIGAASNVIVVDCGVKGVVIRLGKEFARISCDDDVVTAGCAAFCGNVAQYSCDQALSGAEFFSGIPGSIGGAIAMNAGCYDSDVAAILLAVKAFDRDGNFCELKNTDFAFSYRQNAVAEKFIFIEASFKLVKSSSEVVSKKMHQLMQNRENAQPIRAKTGGSTFKNPAPFDNKQKRAWQLIDEAGCRGLQIGDAQISQKHCNFMINTKKAKADDLIKLGNEVKKHVKENCGVDLEWEIKIIGESGEEG